MSSFQRRTLFVTTRDILKLVMFRTSKLFAFKVLRGRTAPGLAAGVVRTNVLARVTRITSLIEHDKLRGVDYFLSGKFVIKVIYGFWGRLLLAFGLAFDVLVFTSCCLIFEVSPYN